MNLSILPRSSRTHTPARGISTARTLSNLCEIVGIPYRVFVPIASVAPVTNRVCQTLLLLPIIPIILGQPGFFRFLFFFPTLLFFLFVGLFDAVFRVCFLWLAESFLFFGPAPSPHTHATFPWRSYGQTVKFSVSSLHNVCVCMFVLFPCGGCWRREVHFSLLGVRGRQRGALL